MGECGCSYSDDRYTLPGPGESLYIVTLHGGCTECASPPGVSIERIDPGNVLWNECKQGVFINGPLPLEQWPNSVGVAIKVGMEQSEFVKAMMPHLVGLDSRDMGEDGTIDECGADVIADEMYGDSVFRPKLMV